jgi:hypothetical protein
MNKLFVCLACSTILLAACNNTDADNAGTAVERQQGAAPAATAAGRGAVIALGLTERQLLDADLVDASGVELGDVEGVARGADGKVDRLLVEIEDSDPDKYVHVPIAGLTTRQDRDDWYVVTTMTRQELNALPAVSRRPR